MTHQQLGEVANSVVANGEQRASMTLIEMQIFDQDCAKYDFDTKQAKLALQKMIDTLPSPGTGQDPETRAAIYWDVLKTELSPSAISRVCRRALAGGIGNPKWLPAPGELIKFALNNWIQVGDVDIDPRSRPPTQCRIAPSEHKRLGREYGDEQFRADEQARIKRQLRMLASEMQRGNAEISQASKSDLKRRGPPIISRKEFAQMDEGEREKQKIAAEEYLTAVHAPDWPLPPLSAELRAKLGVGIPEISESAE